MTKTWNTRLLLVSVLLLMLVVVTPVAATTITVELNKTYEFKNTHLSTIKTLDLGDPSVSKVEIQTTAGDNSDVRVLQQPNVLKITRIFTTPNGTFMGNNVIIEGDQISTIDYTSRPDYRYYINYTVPTFKVTVPGYTGNPMAVRYNDSWAKQDASLFRVANALYLYNGSGIGYTIGDNHYYSSGTFDNAPVDTNDLNYTLYNNRVSLNPYQADAHTDWLLGDAPPYPLAVTGKYYAGALIQDESEQTATIYALSPFVALKQETPISWTDDYGTHSLPMTYVKGEMGNVTLKFANTDPTLTKIGYAFVNSNAQYNMVVKVDTAQLAEKTNEQWQSLTPSDHIIEILYNGILNDFGSPFTYNMTAVGQANAPEATSYSQIAITPGYGMSGNATANQIFIPAESFSTLKDGVYYVYLMGINDDKNIVALSQSTVSIKSGTVPDAKPTTITSVSPISGYRNTTVAFTVNGANYPADLGTSGVNVTLTRTGQPTIVVNVTSVSKTKITGTFQTNKSVNGKWDVVLYTNDAGTTISPGAFTIKDSPRPGDIEHC